MKTWAWFSRTFAKLGAGIVPCNSRAKEAEDQGSLRTRHPSLATFMRSRLSETPIKTPRWKRVCRAHLRLMCVFCSPVHVHACRGLQVEKENKAKVENERAKLLKIKENR